MKSAFIIIFIKLKMILKIRKNYRYQKYKIEMRDYLDSGWRLPGIQHVYCENLWI